MHTIINFLLLIRASIIYQHGIMRARELRRKTGKRFYLIMDPSTRTLIPLSYYAIPGRTDSYQYLRLRGKFDPLSPSAFKDGALFWTDSRYKHNEMDKPERKLRFERMRRRYFTRSPRKAQPKTRRS